VTGFIEAIFFVELKIGSADLTGRIFSPEPTAGLFRLPTLRGDIVLA